MGFESFRIELQDGRAQYVEADLAIRTLSNIHIDPLSVPLQGSTFYLMYDGLHVIELELMDSPVRLSCRFTLCHSPSIDSAFLFFVRELMARLQSKVKICDDVPPEHSQAFTIDEFSEFSAVALRCIAARRTEWIAMFGTQQLSATTNAVHERIILPRCQSGVE